MQNIEHTLRSLDRLAEQEQERSARLEKTLADYQAQANKPFDHEARMRELLARQAQLNAALDLDKNEKQVAPPADDDGGITELGMTTGSCISSASRWGWAGLRNLLVYQKALHGARGVLFSIFGLLLGVGLVILLGFVRKWTDLPDEHL